MKSLGERARTLSEQACYSNRTTVFVRNLCTFSPSFACDYSSPSAR
jgi:hypothetical protein